MMNSRVTRIALLSLILLAVTVGLFGNTGFVYAADRTVVGELWSQDN